MIFSQNVLSSKGPASALQEVSGERAVPCLSLGLREVEASAGKAGMHGPTKATPADPQIGLLV